MNGPFDLIVANILAGPLVALAPLIRRLLAPGGLFAATVHKDIWEPAGFARQVAALERAGVTETISREPGPYYRTSTEPDGWYVLWRRTG